MKLRIGLDFDDVLFIYRENFLEFLSKKKISLNKQILLKEVKLQKKLVESGHVSRRDISYYAQTSFLEGILGDSRVQDSLEVLWKMSKSFSFILVTKRHFFDLGYINYFLRKYPKFESIFLTKSEDKDIVLGGQSLDFFVDDEIKNCITASENGIFTFLLDAPHNQTKEKLPPNIQRVRSWKEIAFILEKNKL